MVSIYSDITSTTESMSHSLFIVVPQVQLKVCLIYCLQWCHKFTWCVSTYSDITSTTESMSHSLFIVVPQVQLRRSHLLFTVVPQIYFMVCLFTVISQGQLKACLTVYSGTTSTSESISHSLFTVVPQVQLKACLTHCLQWFHK